MLLAVRVNVFLNLFMVWILGKDVLNDLKLLEIEFEFKPTLTLTQNANPNLACAQNAGIVIFTARVRINM